MTPTSRAAEAGAPAGSAADQGTMRALEFGAIVEQLAAATAFQPSRELALGRGQSADVATTLEAQLSSAGWRPVRPRGPGLDAPEPDRQTSARAEDDVAGEPGSPR